MLAFVFGFWPPREDLRLRALLPISSISKPAADPVADQDGYIKQAGLDWDVLREAVRWGVRGWSGAGVEAKTEKVTIDGREHVALSMESIEALYHGKLLASVALRSVVFILLTDDQKKTSGSPSNSTSSQSATPATAVTGASPKGSGGAG